MGLAGPAARQLFVDRGNVFERNPNWRRAAEAQGFSAQHFGDFEGQWVFPALWALLFHPGNARPGSGECLQKPFPGWEIGNIHSSTTCMHQGSGFWI